MRRTFYGGDFNTFVRNVKQESIPSRDSTTVTQISALLAVIHSFQPYLLLPHPNIDDANSRNPPKLDGEALIAATATFIKTCEALDHIVCDATRWSLAQSDALYQAATEAQHQHKAFLLAQTQAAQTIKRPSYQLRPTLAVFENGYVAFWGDISSDGAAIIGRGKTPELALADFDAAFQRSPDKQVRLIFENKKRPRNRKSKT